MDKKIDKDIYKDISYFGNDNSKDFLTNYDICIKDNNNYYNELYDKKGDKIKLIIEKMMLHKQYPNPLIENKFKEFVKELDIYWKFKKEQKGQKVKNKKIDSTDEIDKFFFNQKSSDDLLMDQYIEKKKISLY